MNVLQMVQKSGQAQLAELLILGVAFKAVDTQTRRQYYTIISHEGDYIGRAPNHLVEGLVSFLRRNFKKEKDDTAIFGTMRKYCCNTNPITYGHTYDFVDGEYDHRVSRYLNEPLELY